MARLAIEFSRALLAQASPEMFQTGSPHHWILVIVRVPIHHRTAPTSLKRETFESGNFENVSPHVWIILHSFKPHPYPVFQSSFLADKNRQQNGKPFLRSSQAACDNTPTFVRIVQRYSYLINKRLGVFRTTVACSFCLSLGFQLGVSFHSGATHPQELLSHLGLQRSKDISHAELYIINDLPPIFLVSPLADPFFPLRSSCRMTGGSKHGCHPEELNDLLW